jgi:site-specific recombinase XerD
MPRPEIERAAEEDDPVDEAELAAAAFLARYQGRTLDAYRYDLRAFFEWAADDRLDILQATRPQIELYVRAMKVRCLAAATIDRRLSTVCGFYPFAQPTTIAQTSRPDLRFEQKMGGGAHRGRARLRAC